jgi:hypothetical protein
MTQAHDDEVTHARPADPTSKQRRRWAIGWLLWTQAFIQDGLGTTDVFGHGTHGRHS